ncbi:hypothetical protein ABPG72_017635 [Tetrahymena utriculariae]
MQEYLLFVINKQINSKGVNNLIVCKKKNKQELLSTRSEVGNNSFLFHLYQQAKKRRQLKRQDSSQQYKNCSIMQANKYFLIKDDEEDSQSYSSVQYTNINNQISHQQEDQFSIDDSMLPEQGDEQDQQDGDKQFEDNICKICSDQMSSLRYQNGQCDHSFHSKCLTLYIRDQIEHENYPIKCPDIDCNYCIQESILKGILDQLEFRKYKQFSLQSNIDSNFEEFVWCPSVKCQYALINDNNLAILECPVCNKSYCINCKLQQHKDLTCEEYQNSIKANQEEEQIIEIQPKYHEKSLPKQNLIPMEQEIIENHGTMMMDHNQGEDWVCEICYEPMMSNDIFFLICEHIFHKVCLSKYFNTLISQKQFPINCPNSECILPVQQYQIQEILSEEDFIKYEKFTLQNYIDSNADEISWCPTSNCEYAFIIDNGQTKLNCPGCKKLYCLACKSDFHEGQTCKEYQISNKYTEQDKNFEQLVKGQKFKQCSKCKMWVEKITGCDHMTCRCRYQFCYKCGGPYLRCDCKPQFIPFFQYHSMDQSNSDLFAFYQSPLYLNQQQQNQNNNDLFQQHDYMQFMNRQILNPNQNLFQQVSLLNQQRQNNFLNSSQNHSQIPVQSIKDTNQNQNQNQQNKDNNEQDIFRFLFEDNNRGEFRSSQNQNDINRTDTFNNLSLNSELLQTNQFYQEQFQLQLQTQNSSSIQRQIQQTNRDNPYLVSQFYQNQSPLSLFQFQNTISNNNSIQQMQNSNTYLMNISSQLQTSQSPSFVRSASNEQQDKQKNEKINQQIQNSLNQEVNEEKQLNSNQNNQDKQL